jgi:hypothetical protein
MATQNTQQKKTALLEALEKSLGVVTTACKQVGIARKTYYLWLAKDKAFKDAVNDISNVALDFAESKLHNLIREENPTAIIFYIERQEIAHDGAIESKLIEWKPADKK